MGSRETVLKNFQNAHEGGSARAVAATHAFGPFHLDAKAKILFRGSEPLPVGNRAVALLCVLIDRQGVPVTKDELIEAAWAGLAVEESNLPVQIGALRKALGGESGGEEWIETLPRRGYRYIGPTVTKVDELHGSLPSRTDPLAADDSSGLSDKPSIVVLPFTNMSGDPAQEYFADGITEDVITALSRWRWFFVIARNSSFTYKGRAVDVKQVGRELGVRYLMEGSVRKAGNRVRLTAQLIDTESAGHVWADRFDGQLEDIFDLQDRLTSKVLISLKPQLTQAEIKRSHRRRPSNLSTWDLYLRATPLFYETKKAANKQAIALLEQAIKLDPGFASAYARLSACKLQAAYQAWSSSTAVLVHSALDLAKQATQLDAADPLGFDALASVHVHLGECEEAVKAARRALDIDPHLAAAQGTLISALAFLGETDEAIRAYQESEQCNPLDPDRSGRLMGVAIAHFVRKEYEHTIAATREHILLRPGWHGSRTYLAASLARVGRIDEARQAIRELLAIIPDHSIARLSKRRKLSDQAAYEDLLDAVRVAGLPEE
ncbi:MAG: winged helix-turn-helix domain-containing protein [Alphaproteobacteria bacterium]